MWSKMGNSRGKFDPWWDPKRDIPVGNSNGKFAPWAEMEIPVGNLHPWMGAQKAKVRRGGEGTLDKV